MSSADNHALVGDLLEEVARQHGELSGQEAEIPQLSMVEVRGIVSAS